MLPISKKRGAGSTPKLDAAINRAATIIRSTEGNQAFSGDGWFVGKINDLIRNSLRNGISKRGTTTTRIFGTRIYASDSGEAADEFYREQRADEDAAIRAAAEVVPKKKKKKPGPIHYLPILIRIRDHITVRDENWNNPNGLVAYDAVRVGDQIWMSVVGRNEKDGVSVSDSAEVRVAVSVSDLVSVSDTATVAAAAAVKDIISASDAANVWMRRFVNEKDLVSASDSTLQWLVINVQDLVSVGDRADVAVSVQAKDLTNVADRVAAWVNITSTDLVGVSDFATVAPSVSVHDLVGVLDNNTRTYNDIMPNVKDSARVSDQAVARASGNMLTNPEFNGTISPWTEDIASVTIGIFSGPPAESFLRLNHLNATTHTGVSPIVAGGTYIFSFWKKVVSTAFPVRLMIGTDDNPEAYVALHTVFADKAAWQYAEYVFVTTTSDDVRLTFTSASFAQEVPRYIDSVYFARIL